MALLASKRFITKSDLLRYVAGYEGTPESMERMFERDKDELRSLGIVIEVSALDPLFDDEQGYRIKPEGYALVLQDLSPDELGLLSLAAATWKDASLEESVQGAMRRLRSLGIGTNPTESLSHLHPITTREVTFSAAWSAVLTLQKISFSYRKESTVESEERVVKPFGMAAWKGFWYLVGEDESRKEIRTFKLIRMTSEIKKVGRQGAYSVPEDFSITAYLQGITPTNNLECRLRLRKGLAMQVRARASAIILGDDWDEITLLYGDDHSIVKLLMWYGGEIEVISPASLRKEMKANFAEIAHG